METTTLVDPAVRATQELNHFFSQMGVSCQVEHTEARGKYVVATDDLPAGTELVEELPIVSWPSADLLASTLPFCFHCLRLKSHRVHGVDESREASAAQTTAEAALSWSACETCHSCFCSDSCRQLCTRSHRLLCASLPALRLTTTTTTTSTAESHPAHTADASAGGITREALARCVAWLLTRLAATVERQGLTEAMLQADFSAQKADLADTAGERQTSCALVSQLFTQTAAPFNRLIAPPDTTVFANVDMKRWFAETQGPIAARAVKLLRLAAGATTAASSTDKEEGASEDWATAIVAAAVREDTLTTMLGQLHLNAHAVNDYVFLSDEAITDAAPPGLVPETAITGAQGGKSRLPFSWMMKGAAVYTLLSAFNHSCCPNVSVTCVDGTHEVCLKTTEPVKKGGELCITYIPLPADSTRAERQAQLKHYLFQCGCPLCKSNQ